MVTTLRCGAIVYFIARGAVLITRTHLIEQRIHNCGRRCQAVSIATVATFFRQLWSSAAACISATIAAASSGFVFADIAAAVT